MFERVGRLAARHFVWVILAWLVVGGLLKAVAPPLEEVLTFDSTAFLNEDAPSLKAEEAAERLFGEEFGDGAAIVFERAPRLTGEDLAYLDRLESWLRGPAAPEEVKLTRSVRTDPDLERFLASADGAATILIVQFTTPPFEPPTTAAVQAIRAHVAQTKPAGLTVHVTGEAGVGADQDASIRESVDRTTIITLALVILILLWVYRSPVTVLVPLLTIGVALLVSQGVIALLADAGMKVSSLVETFMVVIIFGAGTDYCLFIISRFREDVARSHEYRKTLVATLAVVGGVVASSAGTVIVGFVSQGSARFGMFRTTGPAMGIAVLVTLVAGLTLTPALMRAFGRLLFWPAHPERFGAPEATAVSEIRGEPRRRPLPVAGGAVDDDEDEAWWAESRRGARGRPR